MSRPVCGVCMCLEDETGCGCTENGQNIAQMNTTQELHDNNGNVQVDKNPTFKGGSDIPVAWMDECEFYREDDYNYFKSQNIADGLIPLYTSPQYRELSDDEIEAIADEYLEVSQVGDIAFARAILERAKK